MTKTNKEKVKKAAAILGSIKSEKKAKASRINGKLGWIKKENNI